MLSRSVILRNNYRKIVSKRACIDCLRLKSSAEPKTKTYSNTIIFPKTNFPARSSNTVKEEIQKTAQFSDLYNWQREHLKGTEFVLHDGPPYANGDLHMGHAVNKIIKDINNRSQVLQGNRVHYIPGWDCHGLPIELKALQKAKKTASQNELNDPVHIRKIAREFALKTVEDQKAAFETWGVMADWERSYLTLNKSYVQNQLQQFYKMYEKGLVYRALKPVYWSPSSKTALAEAELEYDPQHKSKEVYVTFPIQTPPTFAQDFLNGKPLSAIIWTTTPWTLVANRAICYNPQLKYSIVTLSNMGKELFLVGSGLIEGLEKTLGAEIQKHLEFEGRHLLGTKYTNKLVEGTLPFLEADHVTEGKGTGLVHTAPAHGPDDFLVALRNNMHVDCNVDESGCYSNLHPDLNGLPVLTEGQDKVIALLGSSVLHKGTYVHSYPLDWRTRKPVILRASRQWFIDTAALKEKALAALEEVKILPPSSSDQYRQGFKAQLEKRPYWCISRQRAWGVPIPAVYKGDDVIVDRRIIKNLCELIEEKGPDVWWTSQVETLVPKDVMNDQNLDAKDLEMGKVENLVPKDVMNDQNLDAKDLEMGKDILDIWFDSGISWTTLPTTKGSASPCDLYCEGVDQLTGWFQSSLLTAVAIQGTAPYKSIFVHGFVVDDKKCKMSKSIGNVIDPKTIMNGGKDKHSHPAYGIDTLRWWVASHSTQHSQIVISKKLLGDCQTEVIRIRNILKYLLGVINDVQKPVFSQKPVLNYFDSYMVKETEEFLMQINENYNNLRYNYVAQSILHFISNKVSGLYCHCVKDRLYCSEKDSSNRISAQLVAHTILVALCKALGPILPHLVEEAWLHHPLKEKPFYFTEKITVLATEKDSIDISVMDAILELKKEVCVIAKNENLKKLEATIKVNSDLYQKLQDLNSSDDVNDSVLSEILELSSVSLEVMNGGKWEVSLSQSKNSQCLRCRKFNVSDKSDKCVRCDIVLSSL